MNPRTFIGRPLMGLEATAGDGGVWKICGLFRGLRGRTKSRPSGKRKDTNRFVPHGEGKTYRVRVGNGVWGVR